MILAGTDSISARRSQNGATKIAPTALSLISKRVEATGQQFSQLHSTTAEHILSVEIVVVGIADEH